MVQRKETQSSLNLFSVSKRNVMTSNRHIQAPSAAAGGAGGVVGGGGGGEDSHSFFFATFSSTAFLLWRLVWRVHVHHPAEPPSTGGTEELYEKNMAALWDITCSLQVAPPPPLHAQSCWCSPRRWGGEVHPSHSPALPRPQARQCSASSGSWCSSCCRTRRTLRNGSSCVERCPGQSLRLFTHTLSSG